MNKGQSDIFAYNVVSIQVLVLGSPTFKGLSYYLPQRRDTILVFRVSDSVFIDFPDLSDIDGDATKRSHLPVVQSPPIPLEALFSGK